MTPSSFTICFQHKFYKATIFAIVVRLFLLGGLAFLTIAQTSSDFVGGQVVSLRLPPVSRRIRQRQRIIPFEGKRNDGLDLSKPPIGYKIVK